MPRRRPIALVTWTAVVALAAAAAAGCGAEPGVEAVGADTATETASREGDGEIALEAPAVETVPTSASSPSTTAEPEPPGSVAVVGDSLTESAAEQIETTLTQNGVDVIALDGLANRRMVRSTSTVDAGTSAIDRIVAAGGEQPEVWVIALGTNDVGGAASPEQFEAEMRELLGHVPAGAPVVWIDLWIRDLEDQVVDANAVIRDVIADRPGSAVADWYSSGAATGAIADDGVHLTGDGRWMFARTITDAVLALG